MNQDQDNSHVPAESSSRALLVQPGPETQMPVGYLPQTETIESDDKIPIAREEGFDPIAIELALAPAGPGFSEKLRLLILTILAAALIIFLFPSERFFKPKTKDLGAMTIGGPALPANFSLFADRSQPWISVLFEMDRLYFREGKLTAAIAVAESALEKVPQKKWQEWQKVHYRYWELLANAGRIHALKTASRAYLQSFPEDSFANYYYAHAFLAATDRIRSFKSEMKQDYRQEAEAISDRIERACNALIAKSKHPAAEKEKDLTAELYRKLRLEQAKLYTLIWRLGGYNEDNHADVVFRDKALDICDRTELADLRETKELKKLIYTHILAHWYWFEGQQIIQGAKYKRRQIEQEVKALNKELRDTKRL
jgi:hypothetical protein